MNMVTRVLIASVDWAALRTDSGSGAGIPRALEDLSNSVSVEEAESAYWRIDNEALVQGELYEAALPTLMVLLSMASTVQSGLVRKYLAELIQQVAFGVPVESEEKLGNGDIAARCRVVVSEAIWILYGWLSDQDGDVRECALLTLLKVDQNETRIAAVLASIRAGDTSPGMRKIFDQIDRGLL